ncbi:hypothetical protein AGABI2DRAFT_212040 [Agaricus bisporus var. bisporus H97]|uniref:hypothetical protein n=1 Tax=Agaricus bisporus var. bisporus (strain H97 / ATCC MYA-4626 / FGSC 10389) TaxID=936046 RepID=UPI00029F7058|nr:hypothetical protein AGABI2DRAFT_212040 [Agaricus bisporus var. bisporus H97]EKV42518.1 hypothetical protein AGABI2DRAFT_212040 [Agaricus bisporus var. bisporus H97]
MRSIRITIQCTRFPYLKPHSRLSSTKASDKLFADAALEEEESSKGTDNKTKSQTLNLLGQEDENWTGDERIQDAVLRMLVDKYKPLRGSRIVTAEEKLKQAPPKVLSSSSSTSTSYPIPSSSTFSSSPALSSSPGEPSVTGFMKPRSGSWATEPLLPSIEGHKPWETKFKAPSHDGPVNIKLGNLVSSSTSRPGLGGVGGLSGSALLDERLVKKEKEKMKKEQQAGRLSQALESTLDYRLGIKSGKGPTGRPNPVSMKGWNSFIEERIEKARLAGVFKNVKGRGQPLLRSIDETNPFIAREEFLMNRIVQQNGAAPPWVEIQGELETAARTFREILHQSWVRRAIRILTTNNPVEFLHKITFDEVKALRDPDWIKKEQSYHDTAIAELNSLVRKYNGLAPHAVRKSYYYTREGEIDRMYEASAKDVMKELEERLRDPGFIGNTNEGARGGSRGPVGSSNAREGAVPPVEENQPQPSWRITDLIREWINSMRSWRAR